MSKLITLQEQRASKIEEQSQLIELAKAEAPQGLEARDFTSEEVRKFNDLEAEILALDGRIATEEKIEAAKKRAATSAKPYTGNPNNDKAVDLVKKFSYQKFFRGAITGKFEGLEKEVNEEGIKENRGNENYGGMAELPGFFLDLRTDRDIKNGIQARVVEESRAVLDSTTANLGIDTIQTDVKGLIPVLRPKTFANKVGVTYMPGLSNPLKMPRISTGATFAWRAESGTAADAGQQTDSFTLTQHGLSAYQEYYRELLMQSTVNTEMVLRQDFEAAIGQALSEAIINGSGTSGQPTGILSHASVNSVAVGLNGGPGTHALIAQLVEAVEEDNADGESMWFVTNPNVKRSLKTIALDSGSGQFLWDWRTNMLDAYNATVSTSVPNDLTKGTASGVCSALIFGDWSQWVVGQFGGISFIVNPFSGDKENKVRLTAHSHWDMNARHGQALAAIADLTTA